MIINKVCIYFLFQKYDSEKNEKEKIFFTVSLSPLSSSFMSRKLSCPFSHSSLNFKSNMESLNPCLLETYKNMKANKKSKYIFFVR